jgi:hypothetical protein
LSKRLSQHYTSSGDLPPCADMSELRFELPSTEPVVHGDAALGRSPKTRVTPEASFEYSSGYIQLMATQRVKRLTAAAQLESVNHDTSRILGFTRRSCRAHGFGRRYSRDNALSKDRSCFGDRSPGTTSVIYAG